MDAKAAYTREVSKGTKNITVYLGKIETTVYFIIRIFVSRVHLRSPREQAYSSGQPENTTLPELYLCSRSGNC